MLASEKVKVRNQILLTVEVASKCGQAISISEITQMLSFQQEPANVEEIIHNDAGISKSVTTKDEFVVLRGYENLFSERVPREKTSERFQGIAKTFAHELLKRSSQIELIAVCGSVAYGNAKVSDDIDLFLITKNNKMWASFLEALLLARVFHIKALVNREKVDICLSYVQEKKQFEEETMRRRLSLLAREFLSLRIIAGICYYKKLLERTEWIGDTFPRLYSSRLRQSRVEGCFNDYKDQPTPDISISNLFVYAMLKNYLSLKAFLRNLTYRKQGKMKSVFEAVITKSSCVYTSERYRELEKIYDSPGIFG